MSKVYLNAQGEYLYVFPETGEPKHFRWRISLQEATVFPDKNDLTEFRWAESNYPFPLRSVPAEELRIVTLVEDSLPESRTEQKNEG